MVEKSSNTRQQRNTTNDTYPGRWLQPAWSEPQRNGRATKNSIYSQKFQAWRKILKKHFETSIYQRIFTLLNVMSR